MSDAAKREALKKLARRSPYLRALATWAAAGGMGIVSWQSWEAGVSEGNF